MRNALFDPYSRLTDVGLTVKGRLFQTAMMVGRDLFLKLKRSIFSCFANE